KILEINPYHPLILGFLDKVENDKADDAMKEMVEVLYLATLIRSGYMLENTQKFASLIEKVLRHNLGVDPNAEAISCAIKASNELVKNLHRDGLDRGIIATFNTSMVVRQAFTKDEASLHRSLNRLTNVAS
ncbi:10083_t:CDS:2, partial [Acaulospora morrowiae]